MTGMLASLCNLPSSPAGAPQPSSKPLCLGCCLCSPGSLNTRSKTTSSLTCWVDSVEGVSRCHKVRVPSAGPNWSLPPVLSPSPPPTPGNQMLSSANPHSFFFFFFSSCRHVICIAGQPSCCQRSLLLLLPPPDLVLLRGYSPDGAR